MSASWTSDGKVVKLSLTQNGHSCAAEVYLYGAHVTSWKDNGKELLFLSSKAILDGSKAIRGGIPVCFPQFAGQGPLPNHGFARTSTWTVATDKSSPASGEGGSVSVTFALETSEATRKLWPHSFATELSVTLAPSSLQIDWAVHNRNQSEAFPFTCALHTYFAVHDITSLGVHSLSGLRYIDKLSDQKVLEQKEARLTFQGEVDRLYVQAPDVLTISQSSPDSTKPQLLRVTKQNLPDAVLWNPWVGTGGRMGDLGANQYAEMVCLEPASAAEPVVLLAGRTWKSRMLLSSL
jgi:glucose-6-phosphate 1-epimerase